MEHEGTVTTEASEQELRALIRIIGDLATVKGGLIPLRATLFERLADLFSADCWVSMTGDHCLHGGSIDLETLLTAPESDGESYLQLIQQSIIETHTPTDSMKLIDIYSGTLSLPHIDSSGEMNGDNRLLYAIHHSHGSDDHSALLFLRQDGQDFTSSNRRLVEIASRHIPWCHDDTWRGEQHAQNPELTLPPRLLPALQLLRTGHTRRQIADELFLSPHTIDGYVKNIFHHFDVQSRVELIHKTRAINIDIELTEKREV